LTDTLLAAREAEATVLLAHTPGPHFPEQKLTDIAFEQQGSSFGERFDAALAEAANRLPQGTPIILIGADTPHLSPEFLRYTLGVLQESKAVIGPNVNRGFYLLGFSTRPVPISEVFAHSSARETSEITRILLRAGVKPQLLEFSFDVDSPLDLLNLKMLLDIRKTVDSKWIPPQTQSMLRDNERIVTAIRELESKWLKTPVSLIPI
jgi:glycosyltransferase A (GT-A) superfamily protein (DUF2064 family)